MLCDMSFVLLLSLPLVLMTLAIMWHGSSLPFRNTSFYLAPEPPHFLILLFHRLIFHYPLLAFFHLAVVPQTSDSPGLLNVGFASGIILWTWTSFLSIVTPLVISHGFIHGFKFPLYADNSQICIASPYIFP